MNRRELRTTTDHDRTVHPVLVALISASYSMIAMAGVTTLAMLTGMDELRAQPPQFPWDLVAVFVGGMALATFLHFLLLAWLRGGKPWPLERRVGWRVAGPLAGMLLVLVVPAVTLPWNALHLLTAGTMMITVLVSLLPTCVCMLDFLRWQGKRVAERVRLVPLLPVDLPRTVRAFFDRHTPELLQAGFRLLGDYRLKQYTPSYGRFFLSANGDTFAEINHTQIHFLPIRTVCLFSLTPDGKYLESSNMRFFGKRPVMADFELQRMPGRTVAEVYDQHQRRLRQLDGGTVRVMAEQDLEPVIWYGSKRLYQLLIAQGQALQNPYADFDERTLLSRTTGAQEVDSRVFTPTTWDALSSVGAPTP